LCSWWFWKVWRVAGGGIDGEGMTEKKRKGWLVKNQGGGLVFCQL